jgi:hypothetical protein
MQAAKRESVLIICFQNKRGCLFRYACKGKTKSGSINLNCISSTLINSIFSIPSSFTK